MNDSISWDPALVKKFSSSNHYKLLNQLRNEVKKYPLNNKKKRATTPSKDLNLDNKYISNSSYTNKNPLPNKSNQSNEDKTNKSTVSFNNAKNFSIYSQKTSIDSQQNEITMQDQRKSNDETSSQNFRDRLNQIDMK